MAVPSAIVGPNEGAGAPWNAAWIGAHAAGCATNSRGRLVI